MNEELIQSIIKAFKDVKLEEGIGLSQAGAIDDYETDEVKAACRDKDEKESWMNITSADLNKYYSSLSFFDAAGMRFHLPAYMIAELKGEYFFGMAFALTHLSDYTRSQFELLNKEQREVVREFLFWLDKNEDYDYNKPHIESALRDYWI
jgi:hypothetical protein